MSFEELVNKVRELYKKVDGDAGKALEFSKLIK